MKINIGKITDSILMALVIIMVFSYAGILASYKAAMVMAILILSILIIALLVKHIEIFKFDKIWIVAIFYMGLILGLNFPKSILYFLLFLLGVMLLYKKNSDKFFIILIRIWKIVSFLLATTIVIQYYFPNIFYKFAKIYYFYSNQYEMVYNLGVISKKYSGGFYEVSFSAFVLSIGIACFFSSVINRNKKMFNIIMLIYLYYAVVLTDKRSFILAIPAIIIMLSLIFADKKLNYKIIFIVMIIIVILIFSLNNIEKIVEFILSDGSDSAIQLSSRQKYWYIIESMVKKSPIIGCGLNSFDYYFNLSSIKNFHLEFAGAHNSYFQIIGEMGVAGAILYFGGIISIFIKAIKCIKKCKLKRDKEKSYLVITATFVIILCVIYAMTGNVFYQPQELITFFVFSNIVINQDIYLSRIFVKEQHR